MGSSENLKKRHLLLGTVSFTVCFAAWGLISASAPAFRQRFHLSATQTAFLVAVPVFLALWHVFRSGCLPIASVPVPSLGS